MDLSLPIKDCTISLCDYRLNKNCQLTEHCTESDIKLEKKERNFYEIDKAVSKRYNLSQDKHKEVKVMNGRGRPRSAAKRPKKDKRKKAQAVIGRSQRGCATGPKKYKESSDEDSSSQYKHKDSSYEDSSYSSEDYTDTDDPDFDTEPASSYLAGTGIKLKVISFKRPKVYDQTDSEDESESDIPEHEDEPKDEPETDIPEHGDEPKEEPETDSPMQEDKPKKKLSDYELMIEKKRQEKFAFLQSLKIDEAKADFCEAMIKSKERQVKKQIAKLPNEMEPPRKSKRLKDCPLDYTKYFPLRPSNKEKDTIPSEMSFEDALMNSAYENFLEDFDIHETKTNDEFCIYDKSILKSLTVSKSYKNLKFPSTITALAWYPSPDPMILAAGDKEGHVALWNANSKSGVYFMRIHEEVSISYLQFCPFNQENLIFSSYDGSIFCGDMIQHTFSKVYDFGRSACTYFDFYSETTYLAVLRVNKVAVIDRRTDGKTSATVHICSPHNAIRTISNHPVDRNLFITTEFRSIKLWDLRKLQKDPIVEKRQNQNIASAFFSPVTGNSILATYDRKYLRMFSTDLKSHIKVKKSMQYENFDAQLSAATWLPNSEEIFYVSCLKGKILEFYDKNMEDYITLRTGSELGSLGPYAFHPKMPALACPHNYRKTGVVMTFIPK